MRQSYLFARTAKEAPKDEAAVNAQLLQRAGFIDKLMAGVYTYLPLGYRVLKKIEQIIREEINRIDGQELLMPALHPKENWEKTGRWDLMPDMYTLKDSGGREYSLGPTHEEIVVPLAKQYISSYRDLPFALYQFQDKFRMELRSKSGLLRGREFIMKDLYSFHATEEDMLKYYEKAKVAYRRIFERVGLGEQTYLTFASGGTFSKYSHEFQTLTSAGEDTIYLCSACKIAINKEIIEDQPSCPSCSAPRESLREERAIEVGNIFQLKTKYTEPFNCTYRDADGTEQMVIMGCYGIGLGRVMGTIAEVHHDDHGITWPSSVAPFDIHIVTLLSGNEERNSILLAKSEALMRDLEAAGKEVLWDDRASMTAGEKLKDSDLVGIPIRIIVSEKADVQDSVEVKERSSVSSRLVTYSAVAHEICA